MEETTNTVPNSENLGNEAGTETVNNTENKEVKTFTQEELNRMMANEKHQGINSVLNKLGVKSVEDINAMLKGYKKLQEQTLSDAERKELALKEAEQKALDAEERVREAELKVLIASNNIKKDLIDDFTLILKAKTKDGKEPDKVINELKKSQSYKAFFSDINSSGTGTAPKGGTQNVSNSENYGAKVAKKSTTVQFDSDYYFKK